MTNTPTTIDGIDDDRAKAESVTVPGPLERRLAGVAESAARHCPWEPARCRHFIEALVAEGLDLGAAYTAVTVIARETP